MATKIGRWQRLWVLVSTIYLIVVIIYASLTFPCAEEVSNSRAFYDRLRPTSKQKVVMWDNGLSESLTDSSSETKRKPDIFDKVAQEMFTNVQMPNGHVMTFPNEVSKQDMDTVAEEYWSIVRGEANRMRIRHLLLSVLWFTLPVATLYGLGWSLGWVYKGFRGR